MLVDDCTPSNSSSSFIVVKAGLKSLSLNLLVHWGCMQDLRDVCILGMFSITGYSGDHYGSVLLLSNVSCKCNYVSLGTYFNYQNVHTQKCLFVAPKLLYLNNC